MSYEEIPNLLYSGKPVYVKTASSTGSSPNLQVPMGVEGQSRNSPRSIFFRNIFDKRTSGDYTFYDENNNNLGQFVDIGTNSATNNDSYYFSIGSNNAEKGQLDVIYYVQQVGGRRRKTRVRRSHKSKGRRTRRY